MRRVTKLALLALTIWLAFAQPTIAQKAQSYSLAPKGCKNLFEEYDYALDQLFPRGVLPKNVQSRDVDYTIVLRYLPSFQTESQIVIVKRVNGTFDVVRYGLRQGDQSIWARLNKSYEKQNCPTDADIRNMDVVITDLKPVTDVVKQTVVSLFEQPVSLVIDPSMRPALTPKDHRYMMEDGETVYVWLSGFQDSAFFRLWSWDESTGFDSPLYDWADRIRKAVKAAQ